MAGDLDNILSGAELPPVTPDPPEAEKPEVDEAEQEEVETGEEVSEVEAEAPAPEVPPTPEPPKEEKVPLAALMAERQKRKELEERLRSQPAPPAPNFREAPELYVEQRVAQRVLMMSEAQAREMFPDYDEVVEEFVDYANANPAIQSELINAAHPALFAYKQGKALRERKEMADLPAYKAKLAAELRAEVEATVRAELEAKYAAKKAQRDAIPPDLTSARATRTPEPVVNASLESILKTPKR